MNAISIEHLNKGYGSRPVLVDLNATVPSGQVVLLLGRNGEGKTTLLRVLHGLVGRETGAVDVLGFDPGVDPVPLHRRSVLMPEECNLYPWMTGHGTAAFMAPLYPAWRGDLFTRLAADIDVPLDQRVDTMSRGTRRKLMLVLALAASPEVLLLDEPFAGFDAVVRRQILSTLIRSLADEGRTLLIATHEIDACEGICDRVLILHNGRLAVDLERDAIKAGVRRVVVQLAEPIAALPTHAQILVARSRGSELELVLRDYTDALAAQLLANYQVRERRVEGLSLEDIFVALTGGKEVVQ